MSITFKKITPKDLPFVLNLFKETADKIRKKKVDHWQYWNDPPLDKIQWVKEGIENGEYNYIYISDEQVGMIRILNEDLLYWGQQHERARYIHSFVIKEQYNGKGIGDKILQKIANEAKKDNCTYLRLDADSRNPKLCRYYENLGFNQVGTKEMTISIYNLYQKKL